MRTPRWIATGLVGLIALTTITGCQDGRGEQITALQERVNSLQIERDQLEQELIIANDNVERANSQLVQANQDLDAARRNAMDLQSRLSAAQLSMTQNPASRQSNLPTDWEGSSSSPGIAWTDIGDTILFDSGKATLKSSGKDKLRQVAGQIRSSFPNRQIWVVGHTDSDPIKKSGWKDNLELSLQRSAAVTRELLDLGLDPQRVVAAGQGEHNPKAGNSGKGDKAQNRRVQIVAVQVPNTN